MTRKQRRSVFIFAGMATLGIAAFLVLNALQDSIVFFYSPSDVETKQIEPGRRIRVGGLVAQGSVAKSGATQVSFDISDGAKTIKVNYSGLLPDLFREGQGIIAEGKIDSPGRFTADSVLAKHDETYMPREVADALKKQGVWKGEGEAGDQVQGSAGQSKGQLTQ
jgi:cytochrome c-type biogenesis protein CcmE